MGKPLDLFRRIPPSHENEWLQAPESALAEAFIAPTAASMSANFFVRFFFSWSSLDWPKAICLLRLLFCVVMDVSMEEMLPAAVLVKLESRSAAAWPAPRVRFRVPDPVPVTLRTRPA